MPPITGRQLTALRSWLVIQRKAMKTARPKSDTARFSRVLSADSAVAKLPVIRTATVRAAPASVCSRSGINDCTRTAVLFHIQEIPFAIGAAGICLYESASGESGSFPWFSFGFFFFLSFFFPSPTHQNNNRKLINNHTKNGTIQFLSLRCNTNDAIHQPVNTTKTARWTSHRCLFRNSLGRDGAVWLGMAAPWCCLLVLLDPDSVSSAPWSALLADLTSGV